MTPLAESTTGHVVLTDHFTARTVSDDAVRVVEMSGELDLASRAAAFEACTAPGHVDVVVDLSRLVFMDSAGYSAFVGSTAALGGQGGSLVLTNAVGGPRRLLDLIEELEQVPPVPLRSSVLAPPGAAAIGDTRSSGRPIVSTTR
jgi:anti-anti-sigma factor